MRNLEVLIIDEADRLTEEGFMKDLRDVLDTLPKCRRTGLFSATLEKLQREHIQTFGLRNPAVIKLRKESNGKKNAINEKTFSVPTKLDNTYKLVQNRLEKIYFVIETIRQLKDQKIIVFFNTCKSVDFYLKLIKHLLGSVKAKNIIGLSGKMRQNKRSKMFNQFKAMKEGVLITTDVVGRGADFQGVHLVIQVDPPQNPEYFVHRVGRTARSVEDGRALILLTNSEIEFLEYLELKGLTLQRDEVSLDMSPSFLAKCKKAILTDSLLLDILLKKH